MSKAAAGRPDSEMNRPGMKWALPLLPLCLAASLAAIAAGVWWVLIGEEWSYWGGVGCTEETAVQAYRERYPAGRYEGKARACLSAIERKQKQEEAEVKRKQEEAEAKRKREEAEAKRKREEAEAKRKREEAEAKRKREEAEAKRKQEEAEAKRKQEEAEAKRKQAEAASQSKLEAERSRFVQAVGREPSADFTDANGWTDLYYAVVLDLPSLAKRLLESGATVDARLKSDNEPFTDELKATLRRFGKGYYSWYRNGDTPLHIAAYSNAVETATLLLERGAAVNAKSDNGFTPLHEAAWSNAVETATLLIKRGAAVNAKSNNGNTPLALALRSDADEVAALLRRQGGAE